ncbi:multidrug effflux MFS transporter [Micromonospora sp. NPDC049679]|uniref:multidrug effflux MFS transporter n=1 Tax=Micromonospora sp. NPDC049679 TaxID=3155920 RepID=UPI0033F2FA01
MPNTAPRAPVRPTGSDGAPTSRRSAAILLVLLGTLTAAAPLSLDMYLPGLPDMTADLSARPAQVQLSLTTCLIGMALGQFLTGPLSDRWGRRRPVIVGTIAYAVLSLLCAFAPSAEALAALRLGQGFAGGMGVVVSRAIVRDLYAGAAAARYFSRLILVFGLAPIAAPSLGSLVLRFTSWRGVFVTLAIIGMLLAALAAMRLPETLPAHRRTTGGLGNILRSMRLLLADRVFVGYTLTQGLAFAALFAYISGSSFVFQDVFGISATAFGLVFGGNALGMVALGQLNGALLSRRSPRTLLIFSLAGGLAAAVALLGGALAGSLAAVTVALFYFVASLGMAQPSGVALALDQHPERAGTAAAVMGAAQSVIGALAAPVVGLGDPRSAVPMAVVVLGALALALVAALTLARPRRVAR